MLKLSKIKVIGVCVLLVVIHFIWPVYESFAYKGKVAFLPFYQFVEIPNESPTDQTLYQDEYKNAGQQALELLTIHKASINAPAITAAVAIDGELTWIGASGWADIEAKVPATTHTQFRIGSTSKALTGTALARLVDKNLIDIDKPISNYMEALPEQWQEMTARQLASHTAGLPHYKENTDYIGLYKTIDLSTRYENVEESLEVFDSSELLFEPGAQFSYSTFGTVLLSAVMQNVIKKPYLEIMQEQVFSPLEMTSTMAEFEAIDRKNIASFYWNNKGTDNQMRKWREVDLSHRLAGGGFISTSYDLVKMGSAFLKDDFISEPTRDMFWTPQILPDGTEAENGYSLGWRVLQVKLDDEIGEVTIANHGGVSRGAQSWLMVIPKYNMSIAVNINSNTDVFWHFGKVSMQLAKLFISARNETVIVEPDSNE